ncbi:MAG: hypothetical protein ACK41O_14635 [Runella zeae]
MKTLWLNDIAYPIRQSWRECSREQIVRGLTIINHLQGETDKHKQANLWVGLVRLLLDEIPDEVFFLLSGDQIWHVKRYFKWALTERITHKPFDSFDFEGVTYFLPEEKYANTSAIELAMANIYYLSFTNTTQPNQFAVLDVVATLCRPQRNDLKTFRQSKAWNGDLREEYNSLFAEQRAKDFKRLDIGYVIAILQYFESMNNDFMSRNKVVLQGDDSAPPIYSGGEGWIAMLEDVAETGVHGTFNQVCSENANTIFLYIRHKVLKNKRAASSVGAQDDDDE